MSSRNNEAAIKELEKTNKKLLSDFKLMHEKIQLQDQTTRIQFRLVKKEIEQSKRAGEKRNQLLVAALEKLKPEFKTMSSVEEMLSGLIGWAEETKVVESCNGDSKQVKQEGQQRHHLELNNHHQQQSIEDKHQQRGYHQQQQHYEQHNNNPHHQDQEHQILCGQQKGYEDLRFIIDQRDESTRKNMMEIEELLKVIKEEVEELKRREHRRVCFALQNEYSRSNDEEPGTSKMIMRGNDDVGDDVKEDISIYEEDLEHHFLPSDTYSYFAVADYCAIRSYGIGTAFSIASFVLIIQLVTLSIFIMDVVDYKNTANPLSVPPGVSIEVCASQLIALLISCWNQDEVRASFNVLSLGYRKAKVRAINHNATCLKWYFSIFIRIVVGWFSLVVTFILIVNSNTVRDVMLDFAAVTFVSELDNGAFQLSQWGYMGKELQQFTMRIKNVPVYERKSSSDIASRRRRKVPRLVWLFVVMSSMTGIWVWVTIKQRRGDYLDQSIFVQFGDDFSPAMGAFSGIYTIELDRTIDGMGVNYAELGIKSDGRFSYCSQDRRWVFQYGSEPEGYDHWLSECWYKARSSETESYDLTETSSNSWYVSDEDLSLLENPLQHFVVRSENKFNGKSCQSNDECGERMYCNDSDNTCVCKDGSFGLNCNFRMPCQTLEIDSRALNGFSGTRSWSRRYSSLSEDAGKGVDSKNGNPIQVYGKPIYVGDESIEGIFDVMVFTGRRWILTDSLSIKDYHNNYGNASSLLNLSESDNSDDDNNMKAKRHLAEFLSNKFHAYWSNYTFHFASEPVDVGTPIDSATPVGLLWFRLEAMGTQGASLRSGEQIWQGGMSIEAKLLCAVCHNETNPCFYGATCRADGTCDCATGSSGIICQIPPDNNGNCDVFFNTPEFAFDGGDCCQETCLSTERYTCGKALLENSLGVSAYGFIGYPNCQDPRFKSKLSGSTTLYEIVEERGFVRCGNAEHDAGFYEVSEDGTVFGFEVDLCKAIAAASLGNPEAIEMVDTSWSDRWIDLTEKKFDVLISRTTQTADRDIFQSYVKTGFSFARIPEFFDGLRYAGIPPYSECADKLDIDSAECSGLRICVNGGSSTWKEITERFFPDSMVVAVDSFQAEIHGLEAGLCNVIAGEGSAITELAVRDLGFTGPSYTLGKNMYSKEPLSAVTREDDRIWSKFVSWVFEALIQAEESGITKSTAELLAPIDVFGEQFENMFQRTIGAVGNFGEIYERNLEYKIPRGGLNNLNTGSSGLMYSFPFGAIDTLGNGPSVGGTLDIIKKRGILNCGIAKHPGFGEIDVETGKWKGFEVDMCRGVAAALFNGSPNVNFIPLTSVERFSALATGTVDLINCATTHTLTREIREVTTGQGFDFTPPIFYDGLGFGGRPPYVGCAEIRVFDDSEEDCSNTRICVIDGTTSLDTVTGPLNIPAENVVVGATDEDIYRKFVLGECNVVAGESTQIMEASVRSFGLSLDEEYRVGAFKFSKEPLAIVSRSDDTQFSDFLRWIVFGYFYAEEMGITRDEYYEMPINYLLGSSLSNMWQHSIEAVGNYGEMYARNLGEMLDRGGPNALNDKNGPQFIAMPGVVISQ